VSKGKEKAGRRGGEEQKQSNMMHEFKFEVENFHSNSIPILNYKKTKSSPEVSQPDRQLSLSLPTTKPNQKKKKRKSADH
jgi:hypothetical protein